jgi:hypothetical protein
MVYMQTNSKYKTVKRISEDSINITDPWDSGRFSKYAVVVESTNEDLNGNTI